jgi:hypothetical protein
MDNLLAGPPPTLLPEDGSGADGSLARGDDPATVAAAHPAHLAAWAALAERAFTSGDPVAAYAYARVGYHRGLDALRRNGWKGQGPVPWAHQPNRGFLASLHWLGRAAEAIGESDEAARCATFLADCDPAAVAALRS